MVVHRETLEWRDIPRQAKTEEIIIRFEIEYHDAEHRSVSSISAELFRVSNPSETYRIPNLSFDQNIKFHHVFAHSHTIHGWLRWRTGLRVTYSQQIIGRVEIGKPGDTDYWIYEGYMIGFGAAHPTPKPDPAPTPDPDVPKPHPDVPVPAADQSDALIIADEHLEMAELFPFVYIKPWPRLSQSLVEERFMLVPADVVSSAFYTQLKGLIGQQKCQAAVSFIDDTLSPTADSTYGSEFLAPLRPLPPPFNIFLEFPPHLRNDCSMDGLNHWVTEKFETWDMLAQALKTPEASATLINLWNSLIALMITTGYDHSWLSKLIRLLQVTHLITRVLAYKQDGELALSNQQLSRMIEAIWVLPDDIFPVFPPATQTAPPDIQPYAVGAIRTVHYKADRYLLGDVQRIEIVTQGETRQEMQRRLRQSEATDEEHRGTDSHVARAFDTTTADLINQVQKTLSERVSATTVDNYQTDYGLPTANTMKVTGNWWVQDQPAGGYIKDISKFARDVIDRAVKVVRQESMQRRKLRIYEEAETTETRTLSNSGAGGDRQTVYRWVNRLYKLETKSSEDRLVFELFLDVPSRHLLQAVSKLYNINITAPTSPEQLGVKSYKDLSPEARNGASASGSIYYLNVFDTYGIAPDNRAPPATRFVTAGLMSRNPIGETCLEIPPGYVALNATATVTSYSQNPQIQVVVGGLSLTAQPDAPQSFKGDFSTAPVRYASQLWASVLCLSPAPAPAPTTPSSDGAAAADPDISAPQGSSEFETFYAFTLQV